ncbi:hypothetical protein D3C71_1159870 [compost metagenome]
MYDKFVWGLFMSFPEYDLLNSIKDAMQARKVENISDIVLYGGFLYYLPSGVNCDQDIETLRSVAEKVMEVDFWVRGEDEGEFYTYPFISDKPIDDWLHGDTLKWNFEEHFNKAQQLEKQEISLGNLRNISCITDELTQVQFYIQPFLKNGELWITIDYFKLTQ